MEKVLGGIPPEKKTKIIRLCKALIPDAQVYLYGSRARGDFSVASDVDLALRAERLISYYDIAELKDILEASNLAYGFDIVDLNAIRDQAFKTAVTQEMILWAK